MTHKITHRLLLSLSESVKRKETDMIKTMKLYFTEIIHCLVIVLNQYSLLQNERRMFTFHDSEFSLLFLHRTRYIHVDA